MADNVLQLLPQPSLIDPDAARRQRLVEAQIPAASDPDALLQLATVKALTGFGKTAIYARIKAGTFPEPVRLSGRCSRWRAGAVRQWLVCNGGAA